MGCFPPCFRHWSHKQTMENVQHQCSSPMDELHESAKLLPATMESLKEDEIANPIKLVPDSDNEETAVSDQSKGTNELTSSNKLEETENERIEQKDDGLDLKISSFLINDKEKEITFIQEESSESLFSLSIDSRRQVFAVGMEDKEVNSPLVMAKTGEIAAPLKNDEDKENATEHGLSDGHQLKKREGEMAADTSLSSWLVPSEKSNKKLSMESSPQSEKNYGERRQVLGAITSVAEFKEMNGVLSGGSTPCCNGDDQLGIGTVGGYWRRRGQAETDMENGTSCGGVLAV